MRKLSTYFFTGLLLLFGGIVQAQDDDYDTVMVAPPVFDSVGSIEDLVEDSYQSETEKVNHFDPVYSYDKSQVTPRPVDGNTVNQMRKDGDFWYVNEAPQKEQPKPQPQQTNSSSWLNDLVKKEWFRNLLWVLVVGGFLAVLIWFIVSSDIQLFRRQSPAMTKQEEDDLVNQSIFDINYDQEIHRAIAAQNYRLAIRLLYLQTLKRLSEENIINYKQERTNNDYVMQLFNTGYYKDFFRLTRHFEYAWYGQFPVAPASFEVIKTDFNSFKQRFLS